jgi:2-polyprenyl-3-methyl-5-hydroxy-6-metoxy-1,4-benzoquinol methylase
MTMNTTTDSSNRSTCAVCGQGRYQDASDIARIASNVRRWREHTSTVWRCNFCGCLHSLERQDLTIFYQEYPYGRRRLDHFTRQVFRHYIQRLQAHGLRPEHAVLDYGCSEGLLLKYLRENGFAACWGYDPYSSAFSDPSTLTRQYDLVTCQDVIEHVEDPQELMGVLSRSVRPGGLLCIGTPRADGIDLRDPSDSIHSLHQPYHLHILSEKALTDIALKAGLVCEKLYLRHSCDTPYPFINWPFLRGYLKAIDDTLDAGFDPPHVGAVARSPRLWFLGVFGYLLSCRSEMIAIFRKPLATQTFQKLP